VSSGRRGSRTPLRAPRPSSGYDRREDIRSLDSTLGPLTARFRGGRGFRLPAARLSKRPVDLHLEGLTAMRADHIDAGYSTPVAKRLNARAIFMEHRDGHRREP